MPLPWDIDDPDWDDAVLEIVRGEIARIRTITPAQVVSYNPAAQTADVQPLLRGRWLNEETETVETYLPAPLVNRPVLWTSFGGFELAGELVPGEDVLLLISDRSIVEWVRDGGADVTPKDLRRFDLGDAMVLPVRARKRAGRATAGSLFLGHAGVAGAGLRVTASTVALGTPAVELLDQVQQALGQVSTLAGKSLALTNAVTLAVNTPTPGAGSATPVTQGSLLTFLTTAGLDPVSLAALVAQLDAIQASINSIRGTP